jgi:hypothetical protein
VRFAVMSRIPGTLVRPWSECGPARRRTHRTDAGSAVVVEHPYAGASVVPNGTGRTRPARRGSGTGGARPLRRSARVVAGALLCLAVAACNIAAPARVEAPADTTAGEIAFRFEGHGDAALVVPVFINEQGPFDFVLDTGATITCVERETAAQLGLDPVRGVVGVGAGVGSAGRLELVRVDSLRIGPVRAFDLNACLLDLQHMEAVGATIHGLVGLNFLRSFRVVLDFERNVVTLTAP